MPERLHSVYLRAEIDTNKGSYRKQFSDLTELVEWWNAHADLGLPSFLLVPDDPEPTDNEPRVPPLSPAPHHA